MRSNGGFFDFLGKAMVGAAVAILATNEDARNKVANGVNRVVNKVKSAQKKAVDDTLKNDFSNPTPDPEE